MRRDRHRSPVRPPIGREQEFADLIAMLTDQRTRLVTITGPGGVGKSFLARRACRTMADRFAWGVVHVDGDHGQDEPAMFGEVAAGGGTAARLSEADPAQEPAPSSRPLLVLDPADGAAAQADALIGSLPPSWVILACAIRPLGIPEERTVTVGPLAVPDPNGDEGEIASSPAVRLFAERAAATDPRFSLAPPLLSPIAAVCAETGGWPLAIEHAAARVGLLPIEALAQLLRERPGTVFEPMPRPGRPTHLLPSLREAFARTWRQLSVPEQSLLRAASQFTGSFSVARLSAVAGVAVPDTGVLLKGLVDLALVRQQDDRFALAPPCRQYATWTFGRRFPERAVRARYLASVCAVASAAARLMYSAEDAAAMHTLADVRDELLPALDHLITAGDTSRALQLAGAAAPCVVQSGEFRDWATRLDRLLRDPAVNGDSHLGAALVGYADIAFTSPNGADMQDLATHRLWRGVQLIRARGDPLALLHALSVVGGAWPVMRDVQVGAGCVQEGIALARRVGAVRWTARFEAWSGMLAHQTGDIAGAITLGTAALTRSRRCGDSRARLLAGILLHTVPDPPEDVPGGLPDPMELLTLCEQLQETRLRSIMLAYLANSALSDRRTADAAYWCARALELSGTLDTWFGAGFAMMFLVRVAAARREWQQAATLHGMVVHRLGELAANLPPHLAVEYQHLSERLRTTIDPDPFDRHVRAGAVMTWRAAVAAALVYAYQAGTSVPAHRERATPPLPRSAEQRSPSVPLSPRESQVLQLIAEGRDAKDIAAGLRITPTSVSHHTSNILRKLGVSNRTQAAIWAVHHEFGPAAEPVNHSEHRPGRAR
jgi:predicted ATPase/DNA-binding CsgD family transcriptional regulator